MFSISIGLILTAYVIDDEAVNTCRNQGAAWPLQGRFQRGGVALRRGGPGTAGPGDAQVREQVRPRDAVQFWRGRKLLRCRSFVVPELLHCPEPRASRHS